MYLRKNAERPAVSNPRQNIGFEFLNFVVLISRWENILQKVTDSVNNSKVYEELKDETKYLTEQMVDLKNSTACTTTLDENEDLDTRMRNIKVVD